MAKKFPTEVFFLIWVGKFNCREFKEFLKARGLKIYFAKNYAKVSIVERFIRTLRLKIKRFMVQMHTENYVDSLQDIIASYNKTFHRSLGTSPDSVSEENSKQIFQTLYAPKFGQPTASSPKRKQPSDLKPPRKKDPNKKNSSEQQLRPFKFSIGDLVRLSNLYRQTTVKESQHQNWTEEVFRVIKRSRPDAEIAIYEVEDLKGGEIDGRWYEEELKAAVNLPENKILDPKWKIEEKKEGRQSLFTVKYLGWPQDFNEELTLRELNSARERSRTAFSHLKKGSKSGLGKIKGLPKKD